MSKISAKDATVLIGGYNFSTYATSYDIKEQVDAIEVSGFGDGSHNFVPGQNIAEMNTNMLWDSAAGKTVPVLDLLPSGKSVTILPEVYALGCPSISMPFMQATFDPAGTPKDAISLGTIKFMSSGNNLGVENGWCLQHGTITNSLTGTGVLDPSAALSTAACAGTLHVWSATSTDTYVVKIQHSSNNSSWTDLITFAATGTTLTSERIQVASGTINKYRRVLATRTGTAGDTLGFTVHFYHQ
jgi:hypothetical protein